MLQVVRLRRSHVVLKLRTKPKTVLDVIADFEFSPISASIVSKLGATAAAVQFLAAFTSGIWIDKGDYVRDDD